MGNGICLGEACQQYLHHCEHTKKLSEHSLRAYQHDLKTFLHLMGVKASVETIEREHLYGYIEFLYSEGRSEATVKRRIACLKTLFKWLEKEGLSETNPFSDFDLTIRIPKRLPRNLNVDELREMLHYARTQLGMNKRESYESLRPPKRVTTSEFNQLNTLTVLELLFCTGVRIGELTSIALEDINLYSQSIQIQGKGQRERKVYIPDKEITALLKHYVLVRMLKSPMHSQLLINSRGSPLTTQVARLLVKKNAEAARLTRNVTPHMYRHSAATQMLEEGVDIRIVQKLLGHESIETTQIYTHVQDTKLKNSVIEAGIRRKLL